MDVARKGQAPSNQIAKDVGILEGCLHNWMKKADVVDGSRHGLTNDDRKDLREEKKRIRLLEQENEVLRRAAAHLSQANLPDHRRRAQRLTNVALRPQPPAFGLRGAQHPGSEVAVSPTRYYAQCAALAWGCTLFS